MSRSSSCTSCKKLRRRVADLERLVERLSAEVEVLRGELAAARRAGRRQAAPFSRGKPAANPRPPGRKPGDAYGQRASRPVPERVDETHEAPLPSECPHCQVGGQIQEDIPPVRTIIRRFRVHVGRCRSCGRRVQGHHPLQTSDALGAAAVQIGPNALAIGAQMNKELGVPYAKVAVFFQTTFLMVAASASFCRANLRLADKAQSTYQAMVLALHRSAVVYGDETGWKIAGHGAWLWAFVTSRFTVYLIRRSRGFDVVAEALGPQFSGLLGRDGWCAWKPLSCQAQSCLAHPLRRCRDLLKESLAGQARFPLAVKRLLTTALALRDRRQELSAHGFAVATGQLEAKMDRLLAGHYTHEPNARFAKHLRRERPALFTFLHNPKIEATNWPAEHAIRPAVVNRKTSGGSRSDRGAEAQAVLTSIIRSIRQTGDNPVPSLVSLLYSQTPLDLRLAKHRSASLLRPP